MGKTSVFPLVLPAYRTQNRFRLIDVRHEFWYLTRALLLEILCSETESEVENGNIKHNGELLLRRRKGGKCLCAYACATCQNRYEQEVFFVSSQ